jgi:hypothetical protein
MFKNGHLQFGLVPTALTLFVVAMIGIAFLNKPPKFVDFPSGVEAATRTPTLTPVSTGTPTAVVTPTVRPTRTKSPTRTLPANCANRQTRIGEMTVNWHSGMLPADCTLITNALEKSYQYFSKETDLPIVVDLFGDLVEVTDYEYLTYRKVKGDRYDAIMAEWKDGPSAGAYYQNILVYTGNWWRAQPEVEKHKAVVHEMTHQTQHQLSGMKDLSKAAPVWFFEGQAEAISRWLQAQWGMTPIDISPSLANCDYTLEQMSESYVSSCVFDQGQEAVILMRHLAGEEKSLDIWRHIGQGKTFEQAFAAVYGMPLTEFEQWFELYRKNNYKWPLPTTPTKTPTPGGN